MLGDVSVSLRQLSVPVTRSDVQGGSWACCAHLQRQHASYDASCWPSSALFTLRQAGRPCLRGLSCLADCRIMDTSSHSAANQGTFSYAAPELLLNQKLDVKVRVRAGMTCNVLRCHRQELQTLLSASVQQAVSAAVCNVLLSIQATHGTAPWCCLHLI